MVVVKECRYCPFRLEGYGSPTICRANGEGETIYLNDRDLRQVIPAKCPLRAGPVTVTYGLG